jgi:sec-independent protein translocase protein TatB
MNLGAAEILVICVVALLVFGPQRLPEIARQVGGAMRELRKMQDSVKSELKGVLDADAAPYEAPTYDPLPESALPEPEPDTEPDHTDFPPPDESGFSGPTGSFS